MGSVETLFSPHIPPEYPEGQNPADQHMDFLYPEGASVPSQVSPTDVIPGGSESVPLIVVPEMPVAESEAVPEPAAPEADDVVAGDADLTDDPMRDTSPRSEHNPNDHRWREKKKDQRRESRRQAREDRFDTNERKFDRGDAPKNSAGNKKGKAPKVRTPDAPDIDPNLAARMKAAEEFLSKPAPVPGTPAPKPSRPAPAPATVKAAPVLASEITVPDQQSIPAAVVAEPHAADDTVRLFNGIDTHSVVLDPADFVVSPPLRQPVAPPKKPAPLAKEVESLVKNDASSSEAVSPLRERVRSAFATARNALYATNNVLSGVAPVPKTGETMAEAEERHNNRQMKVRIALGVAVVAKVGWSAYLAAKGMSAGGSPSIAEQLAAAGADNEGFSADGPAVEYPGPAAPYGAPAPAEVPPTGIQAPEVLTTPAPKGASPATHTLAEGENPWGVARNHLMGQGNTAPSASEINTTTNQILQASGITPEESNNLPIGFELTLPGDQTVEAATGEAPTERLGYYGDTISKHAINHLTESGVASPSPDEVSVEVNRWLTANDLVPDDPRQYTMQVGQEIINPHYAAPAEAPAVEQQAPAPAVETPESSQPIPSLATVYEPLYPEVSDAASDGFWERYRQDHMLSDIAVGALALGAVIHEAAEAGRDRKDNESEEDDDKASSAKKKKLAQV